MDDTYEPPEPDPFILAHTFGLLGQSDDFRRVLLRLCSELKARFNIYVDLPSTLDEIATAFPRFLAHAALFGKIIVLLDGLDRADMRGIEQDDWLPSAIPSPRASSSPPRDVARRTLCATDPAPSSRCSPFPLSPRTSAGAS